MANHVLVHGAWRGGWVRESVTKHSLVTQKLTIDRIGEQNLSQNEASELSSWSLQKSDTLLLGLT
jgi:hypothetical protein